MGSASTSVPAATPAKESTGGFFKALAGATVGRSKDKDKGRASAVPSSPSPSHITRPLTQSTNIFSLVERFTFRPSPNETLLPSPPPLLPPEIQYWAGVIMRNACRKDESRGGIRQCANMLCGKWESMPREFAKCRRCRKAKYCGKECQSRAWAEGHRFWCSAREEEEAEAEAGGAAGQDGGRGGEDGAVRTRGGERVRVSVSATNPLPEATASTRTRAVQLSTISNTASRTSAATTTLYRAGPEPGGRGPPPGQTTYTRNRVNALAPYAATAQAVAAERNNLFPNLLPAIHSAPSHAPSAPLHAPYLHMAGGAVANARRRVGTLPGPSVSTTDLPGVLRAEEAHTSEVSREGEGGVGPDDMVLG